MTREEIINELRKYAHPSWFKKILSWPTKALMDLLDHYKTMEDVESFIARRSGEPLKNVMKFKK